MLRCLPQLHEGNFLSRGLLYICIASRKWCTHKMHQKSMKIRCALLMKKNTSQEMMTLMLFCSFLAHVKKPFFTIQLITLRTLFHGSFRCEFQQLQFTLLGCAVSVSRVPLLEFSPGSASKLSDILSQIISTSLSNTAWNKYFSVSLIIFDHVIVLYCGFMPYQSHFYVSDKRWKQRSLNVNPPPLTRIRTYPNIYVLFRWCFEKFQPETISQLLAALVGYHPLILHVALVPDKDHLCVVPAVRFDLCAPEEYEIMRERRLSFICDLICKEHDVSGQNNAIHGTA